MTTSNASKPQGRIPLLEPQDMTPEQREQYERNPAAQINLSRLMGQARTLAPHLGAFNMAMASSITIPPLERELITLAVLHLDRGEYEWAQHMEVCKIIGFPQDKVEAIAQERFGDAVFNDREKALLAFTRQVVKTVRVDDFVFNAVAAFYDARQLVEAVFVIGNYMTILRISEVAQLPIDSVAGANFWKKDKPAAE